MFAKCVFVICAGLLVQTITGQCIGAYDRLAAVPKSCSVGSYDIYAPTASCSAGIAGAQGAGWYGLGAFNAAALAASNGCGVQTSSSSYLAPNGMSVVSENSIEGALSVFGALPFLGTVALEGVLPSAGVGGVAYNCGNGEIVILSENVSDFSSGVGSEGEAFGIGSGASGIGARASGNGAGLAGSPAYGSYGITNIGGRGACGCNSRTY